jgi:hypothetical protein
VIELEQTELKYRGYEGEEALLWNLETQDLYGNEDEFEVYFVKPSFYS